MLIQDYDYTLPDELIARRPCSERDGSRLLIWNGGAPTEDTFQHLAHHLEPHTLLITNDTRVIRARLFLHKPTGARIEIFLLEPAEPADYAKNFAQRTQCTWVCLVGGAKKWKTGTLSLSLRLPSGIPLLLTAERLPAPPPDRGLAPGEQYIHFTWDNPQATFSDILEAAGELPIPPYLRRPSDTADLTDYQTIFAQHEGSVAAPTAALHFTPRVLQNLADKGIEHQSITLHVGAGTFRPVKTAEVESHEMHAEPISVEKTLIERLIHHHAHCTAVGTTSVRTLESLYHIGLRLMQNPHTPLQQPLFLPQWAPYEENTLGRDVTPTEALQAILEAMNRQGTHTLSAHTQIMIKPGYRFRIVSAMVTNFHQPRSTLLLLVSAFTGGHWREIYDYALQHRFRFLSYGDACLLMPPHPQPMQ